MPELPEVETIVRRLDQRLRGAVVNRVDVLRADIVRVRDGLSRLRNDLPGARIVGVTRRAKRILIDVSPHVLAFHLGMSGRLTLCEPGEPLAPHTHVRVRFHDPLPELRFRDPRRFGGVWCYPKDAPPAGRLMGPLGPEPLELKPGDFTNLLHDRRRQIKALLMDQRVIAGLGNIYVDESLFDAGVHPLTHSDRLSEPQCARLLHSIQKTLRRAIASEGSTLLDYRQADGAEGHFQRLLRVFRRTGLPCPRCRTAIVRIKVCGRSTHYCPKCQKQRRSHS